MGAVRGQGEWKQLSNYINCLEPPQFDYLPPPHLKCVKSRKKMGLGSKVLLTIFVFFSILFVAAAVLYQTVPQYAYEVPGVIWVEFKENVTCEEANITINSLGCSVKRYWENYRYNLTYSVNVPFGREEHYIELFEQQENVLRAYRISST